MMIMSDLLTILESYLLVTSLINYRLSHSRLDWKGQPTWEYVIFVWTFKEITRCWRMMACLFHVNFWTILTIGLVSFTQNRIERLLKKGLVIIPVYRLYHYHFESLKRIRQRSGIIQVDRHSGRLKRNCLKKRIRAHALNWKTNPG